MYYFCSTGGIDTTPAWHTFDRAPSPATMTQPRATQSYVSKAGYLVTYTGWARSNSHVFVNVACS